MQSLSSETRRKHPDVREVRFHSIILQVQHLKTFLGSGKGYFYSS